MPIDMTMEEPHPRVIGLEPQHHIPTRLNHDGVAADRGAREMRGTAASVWASVYRGSGEELESVAVEVEGVAAVIEVVEDDVDGGVMGEDVRVGVDAVDDGVCGLGAGAEGGVEGGDFLG